MLGLVFYGGMPFNIIVEQTQEKTCIKGGEEMKTKSILTVSFLVLIVLSGSAYGYGNTVIGDGAGSSCDTCNEATFIGYYSGSSDRATHENTYVGFRTGEGSPPNGQFATGVENTFIGSGSGSSIVSGSQNTFVGMNSGLFSSVGSDNVFIGHEAGFKNNGVENTFVGTGSGHSNSVGNWNAFLGFNSGYDNNGYANVFLGANAGSSETGSQKLYIDNCYLKDASLKCTRPLIYGEFDNRIVMIDGTLHINGSAGIEFPDGTWQNTALKAVSGSSNSYFGQGAGYWNSAGANDTFLGKDAGYNNTSGNNNSFIGYQAGYSNVSGQHNTFVGDSAGRSNSAGNDNTFTGYRAGYYNSSYSSSGSSNTFLGSDAGYANTYGSANTFLGISAGNANTDGNSNAFIGSFAGMSHQTGNNNTFIGNHAGQNNVSGSWNVFIGYSAGNNETGSNKLYVDNCLAGGGFNCTNPLIYGEFDNRIVRMNGTLSVVNGSNTGFGRVGIDSVGNLVALEFLEQGVSQWFAASYGGTFVVFNTPTKAARMVVAPSGNVGFGLLSPSYPLHMASGAYVSEGGVWTDASSRQYKDNIHSLSTERALEALKQLNPVTFTYKTDPDEQHVGFIAEDVPDLVATRDRRGVSAMDIVAVLTKVVQEQRKVVDTQQRTLDEQRAAIQDFRGEIASLRAEVNRLKREETALKK